jgi:hypothetical protein
MKSFHIIMQDKEGNKRKIRLTIGKGCKTIYDRLSRESEVIRVWVADSKSLIEVDKAVYACKEGPNRSEGLVLDWFSFSYGNGFFDCF